MPASRAPGGVERLSSSRPSVRRRSDGRGAGPARDAPARDVAPDERGRRCRRQPRRRASARVLRNRCPGPPERAPRSPESVPRCRRNACPGHVGTGARVTPEYAPLRRQGAETSDHAVVRPLLRRTHCEPARAGAGRPVPSGCRAGRRGACQERRSHCSRGTRRSRYGRPGGRRYGDCLDAPTAEPVGLERTHELASRKAAQPRKRHTSAMMSGPLGRSRGLGTARPSSRRTAM